MWGLALAGCGAAGGAASAGPRLSESPARPLQIYGELGLITGPEEFPAVGSVSALAGSADSTLLLIGVSLPNEALRFQREGAGFSAGYVVSIRVSRDSGIVRLVDRTESVRVEDFAETARTEPSVLFQTAVQVAPGRYELALRVRDALTARGFEAADTLDVPRLGPDDRRLARPVVVHRAQPRLTREIEPRLILNPRHAFPYGGEVPRIYLEVYGDTVVTVELLDEAGALTWQRDVRLVPGPGLAAAVVELPADSLTLGRFRVAARVAGEAPEPVPLLITLSDRWLVANFDEVLQFLRYIASPEELEALGAETAQERRERWDAFWADRDPVPATPVNEFREEFFERIAVAMGEFSEPGRPGWRTDRGEVYIVLGPPTRFAEHRRERSPARTGEPDTVEWTYDHVPGGGRLRLIFMDPTGFGEYRLTPGSEVAFREVARRIRERAGRR